MRMVQRYIKTKANKKKGSKTVVFRCSLPYLPIIVNSFIAELNYNLWQFAQTEVM